MTKLAVVLMLVLMTWKMQLRDFLLAAQEQSTISRGGSRYNRAYVTVVANWQHSAEVCSTSWDIHFLSNTWTGRKSTWRLTILGLLLMKFPRLSLTAAAAASALADHFLLSSRSCWCIWQLDFNPVMHTQGWTCWPCHEWKGRSRHACWKPLVHCTLLFQNGYNISAD